MDPDELVDVVDAQGVVVMTVPRSRAEAENYMTANVLIFVFDEQARVWLHKRSESKKLHPGLWDISACGGIASGESPEDAAHRELREEIGISCGLQHVDTFVNTFGAEDGRIYKRLSHLYIGLSREVPRVSDEADAFLAVAHDALPQVIRRDRTKFVPPLLSEYERAHRAYLRWCS